MVKFFRFTTNPNSMAENDDKDVDDELDEGILSSVVLFVVESVALGWDCGICGCRSYGGCDFDLGFENPKFRFGFLFFIFLL